ncbi:MAG: hypothetical protein HKN51_08255 [Saprospiraceae bacterium]|nr:hypothetical protein [Saprospiraceae bacterium]
MFRKLQLLTLLILIQGGLLSPVIGQKSLVKAQRQFELKAFDLAIENAKKALEKEPDCVDCYFVVAESFRMMNENVDAAIWYRKMEQFKNLPNDFAFNYGLLLKRMGQYDKAAKYFNAYAEINPPIGTYFAESCSFAKEKLASSSDFELNLYSASSKFTDYAPTLFKDKLVFASFRDDFKRSLDKKNKSLIQNKGSQLFIGGLGLTGDVNSVNFLLHEDEETFDSGPVHYASDAPICAITRNNFKNGEKHVFSKDLELTLFTANVEPDGSFNNKKPYPFNEAGYASGFGALNETGNIMYFASNRPGGLGGFDLYVTYYKNGEWTYPENLGSPINTEGNEITPFYIDGSIYYSSDFLMGLGGFDVFKSVVKNGAWTFPENMGNGVNSPEDDYYLIKQPQKESYYLTSNRLGGRGAHDIYLVHKAPIKDEVVTVDFEDVAPAPVSLEEDIVQNENPKVQSVKLEEDIIDADMDEEAIAKTYVDVPNEKSSELIDFNKLLPPKAVDLNKSNARTVSLVGAKRVAFGEVIKNHSNVYFIQLAALFKSAGNIEDFIPLKRYGSLYKVKHTNATKVKLGYFMDESQAKEVLRKVKSLGYSDAFITYETLNTSRMELVTVSEKTKHSYSNAGFTTEETTGVNYKIRLASYEDPIWFDVDKVNDLGIIEQWSKGEWTIFVLSGYGSQEEAEKVKNSAYKRGFTDAEVVLDRNGILEKLR